MVIAPDVTVVEVRVDPGPAPSQRILSLPRYDMARAAEMWLREQRLGHVLEPKKRHE